jgi:alkylation response protein AidB-like acyl-CoA dehydrogenase
MYLDLTPEQRKLRDHLRGYFTTIMTPALQDEIVGGEGGGPLYKAALRKMGRDGWLGIGWPREFGGQGRSPIEQFIFSDEVQRAGFPLPFLTLNTVGPTLMENGTEEQKREFLPKILAGDCHFAIGYSEPSAGTDLASLRTRAVRDGDHWVINGSKVFTSLADYSDYIWLAARTDPDAPKHKGISIFMVPTTAPGYKLTPIWTMAGVRTNATYYEDVRVPASALVGQVNQGWWLITSQLNRERVALSPVGGVERLLEEVTRWAAETRFPDGRRVLDQEWVQAKLARVRARWEALKLLAWRQAWAMTQGSLNFADASVVKVYASEFYVEAYAALLEVLGQAGTLKKGSAGALLQGRLEFVQRATLILTFGGGTNEVQRDIIAIGGLQMPRSLR